MAHLMSVQAAQQDNELASRQREKGTVGFVGGALVKGHSPCCALAPGRCTAAIRHRPRRSFCGHISASERCA